MSTHGRQFVQRKPGGRFSETAMALIERRLRANGRPSYRARVKHLGRTLTSTHPDRHSAVQWASEIQARLLKEGPQYSEANKRRLMHELIDRYEEYVLPLKRNGPNQRHQLQWWRDRIGKTPVERVIETQQWRGEAGALLPLWPAQRWSATRMRAKTSAGLSKCAIGPNRLGHGRAKRPEPSADLKAVP